MVSLTPDMVSGTPKMVSGTTEMIFFRDERTTPTLPRHPSFVRRGALQVLTYVRAADTGGYVNVISFT